jgi:methylmalonyl-CoA mutase cobalamin-binding subunit
MCPVGPARAGSRSCDGCFLWTEAYQPRVDVVQPVPGSHREGGAVVAAAFVSWGSNAVVVEPGLPRTADTAATPAMSDEAK